jgi:hypothetical protein
VLEFKPQSFNDREGTMTTGRRYGDHELWHFETALQHLRAVADDAGSVDMAERLERLIRGERDERARELASMLVSPETQLANVRRWNAERGWGFGEGDFASLGEAPPQILGGLLIATVLEVRLDTPARTFEELVAVASAAGTCRGVNPRIRFDDGHFSLARGVAHLPGLRWRIIDLAAGCVRERCPYLRVRDGDPAKMPEAGILAALAHFPEWVRLMGDPSVPAVHLTGYRVKIESERTDIRPAREMDRLVVNGGWRGDRACFIYYDDRALAEFHAVPEYVDA